MKAAGRHILSDENKTEQTHATARSSRFLSMKKKPETARTEGTNQRNKI
jgi:hypothetical protein